MTENPAHDSWRASTDLPTSSPFAWAAQALHAVSARLLLTLAIFVVAVSSATVWAQALCPPGAGNSLSFDGSDDRVACGNVYPGSNLPHTIEAWLRVSEVFPEPIVGRLIAGQHGVRCCGAGFGLWFLGTSVNYFLDLPPCGGAGGIVSDQSPEAGVWHHYAGTWDGGEMRLYRDGQLIEALGYSTGYGGFSQFNIGATQWGVGCGGPQWVDFFPGDIDEVRLWDHARSQTEIQATMSLALLGSEPGLVGYWPMDEGTGTTTLDLGPGGHHGTISGAQWVGSCIQGFCAGDGSATACQCGNSGAPGHGCSNGTFASGSALGASGEPSVVNDTLVLEAQASTPSQFGLFFQGDSAAGGGDGVTFGDGLRCAGGIVVRLETVLASGSGSAVTSASVSAAGGLSAGDLGRYQWWYRDASLSPCGGGFNLSNGLEVIWAP